MIVTETGHGRTVGQAVALSPSSGDLAEDVYTIATVPDADSYTITATVSIAGALDIHSVVGGADGFVASAAGTEAHQLGIDLIMPIGLYKTSGGLINASITVHMQARRIDDAGAPVGNWVTLGVETITDRTTTPQRRSFTYDLAPPGRYRVRVWRVDQKTAATNTGHQVMFSGLRAYLQEAQDFGAVTMIAMKMRATNNLSLQASRKVSVLATRKMPIWDGNMWGPPQPTSSIAWALADAARDGNYGASWADNRIDLEALLDLDALWASRGDAFDARFDNVRGWWDAASAIARVGRARVFLQGGILRIVRDGPVDVAVAHYSPRNIRRGSFGIDYLLPSEDTADAVDMGYFDGETWTPQRVLAALPDSSSQNPARADLFGATARDHVLREGLYTAASNRYRRRIARFSTEMEGFIPSIGDPISIAHDMPNWSVSAEIVNWDPVTLTLEADEAVEIGAGAHYVALRRPDGSLDGPYDVSQGSHDRALVLSAAPDFDPLTGPDRERTHISFGPATTFYKLAKVVSTRPRGLYDVDIEAVLEAEEVHVAEIGQAPSPRPVRKLPRVAVRPAVTSLLARRMPGDALRIFLTWRPAPGAEIYQVEMAEGSDVEDQVVSWTRVAETTAAHHVVSLLYSSATLIRVRALGLAAGDWLARAYGDLIADMWNTDDLSLIHI